LDLPREVLLKEGFNEEEADSGLRIYKAVGCGSCTDGYKGRTGLYQVMPVSDEIARIILRGGTAVDIADQAVKEGVMDLRQSGLQKVKEGITTLDEVNQCTVE